MVVRMVSTHSSMQCSSRWWVKIAVLSVRWLPFCLKKPSY